MRYSSMALLSAARDTILDGDGSSRPVLTTSPGRNAVMLFGLLPRVRLAVFRVNMSTDLMNVAYDSSHIFTPCPVLPSW